MLERALILLLLLVGIVAIMQWVRYRAQVSYIIGLLQTCLSDCIRHMENTTRDMPGSLGKKRFTIIDDYVKHVTNWQPMSPLVVVHSKLPELPNLTGLAVDMIKMNEATASSHWFKTNGLRTGMQAVLLLLVDKNPEGSRVMLVQLMQRQRDEVRDRGTMTTDGFTHLKMVLGLPIEWPTYQVPEQLLQQRLSWWQESLIRNAVNRYEALHLNKLVHKQWPTKDGEDGRIYRGREVLEAMADYVR